MRASPAGVGAVAAMVMLVVYGATLAPGITFWDSAELIAAVDVLGVPHPPGVPLYVLAARAFSDLLALFPRALGVNLFSAACGAAAIGVLAWLLARWLGDARAALAGALVAGGMSTVWRNATEAEVYAPALLVSLLALAAAERAAGADGRVRARWLAVTAYLLALAVPLHLGVLVVAPAAMVAVLVTRAEWRWGDAALLAGVTVLAAAAGRGSAVLLALGAATCVAAAVTMPRGVRLAAPAAAGAAVLAWSAALYVPVRAMHRPAIDTGHAVSWEALRALLAREQYAVPGLWPRQAPPWAQLANWFEYADWQFALVLGPEVMPTVARTAVSVLFIGLAVHGARTHWRRDRRSVAALGALFAAGSVGLVAYMNFKLGATFGHGVLPDELPHEVRDRDYFFAPGFVALGAWAGLGAMALARGLALPAAAGMAVAVLPIVLNAPAVSRRGESELPRAVANAVLWSAPRDAIVLTGGDNDSFPLWYEQMVHAERPDVRVVVVPLLGARWYREELARDSLIPAEVAEIWRGTDATMRTLARAARAAGRPLAVAPSAAEVRWIVPDGQALVRGVLLVEDATGRGAPLPAAGARLDTAVIGAYEARFAHALADAPPPGLDPAPRTMHRVLRCPLVMREALRAHGDSLAQPCSFR